MSGTYLALVRQVIPHALAGLVAGSILTGLMSSAWAFIEAPSFSSFAVSWALGLFFGMWAVLFGGVLAIAYGAPAYALLAYFGRNTLVASLFVGAAPGALLWACAAATGPLYLVFGSVVAACTHLLYRRHGPNNSSKPTPLRGAA